MTDRPILFSAPMVRALLDGRKTQTRRILTLPKWSTGKMKHVEIDDDGSPMTIATESGCLAAVPVRFGKGDRLWVKENWLPDPPRDDDAWDDWECSAVEFDGCGLKAAMVPPALRKADHALHAATWTGTELRWKPSIHMPRWASRLTLTVTGVRVQRLQEITPADAIAEGIWPSANSMTIDCETRDPRDDFAALWRSINGPDSWAANPWIVALSFTVERQNIGVTP